MDNEDLMKKTNVPDESPEEQDGNITTKLMKNFTVTKGYDNFIFDNI